MATGDDVLIGGAGSEIQSGGNGEHISVTGFEVASSETTNGPLTEEHTEINLISPLLQEIPSEIRDSTELTLNWSPSEGASEYKIYRFTADDTAGNVFEVPADSASYTFRELVPGTTYYFGIKAVDANGGLHGIDAVQDTFIYAEGAIAWNRQQPAQQALKACINDMFPGVMVDAAPVPRFIRGGIERLSDHAMGKAVDVYFDAGDNAEKIRGDALFLALQGNADALGIAYVIWDGKIWETGKGVHLYNGSHPHHDHIHVSFTTQGSQNQNFSSLNISAALGFLSASQLSSNP
jgi:hypothetical protein